MSKPLRSGFTQMEQWYMRRKDMVFFPSSPQQRGVHPVRIGFEHWQAGWSAQGQPQSEMAFFLITGGCALVQESDRWRRAESGRLLLQWPYRPFAFQADPEQGLAVLVLGYVGLDLPALLDSRLPKQPGAIMAMPETGLRQQWEDLYLAAREHQPGIEERLRHWLPYLLSSLRSWQAVAHPDAAQARFLHCKKVLDASVDGSRGLAELCLVCEVSYPHLHRLFQRFLGVAPRAYLQQLRMNTAAQLLQMGDHSLAELAERFGYADAFSFSKAFKRCHGLSPQRYRERAGGPS